VTCEACRALIDGDHLHLCNDCAGSIDRLTTARLEESFYDDLGDE
jgi:hypothetical protein